MKTLALLLVPLAAVAAPARHSLPELSVSDWSSIQSGAFDNLRHLADWSFRKVEKVFDLGDIEADIGTDVQDDSQLTIWQQLKADPNSFSKLVKLIEFEGNAQKVLDDRDLQITFFAPNNDALKPSEHHGHHDSDNDFDEVLLGELSHTPSLATLSALLDRHPSLLEEDDHHKHSHHGHGGNDDDDDDEKKKRRKEIFRKIAGYVLMYHGLEKPYTARELAQNSTFPTALKAHDGSYGGLHRRIKVERSLLPPSIKLNGYARVLVADKKAINGYFHTLQHPLFPPPSILEEAFLFPDVFSTATSAVQQVGGAKYLDWSYDRNASSRGHPVFTGVPLTTFFLPTNAAFALLPPRLKFFLFSKFGHRALAKILMYHAVPRTLLLSEFIYTEHHKHEDLVAAMRDGDDPSFHREIEVPTALENATLNVVIDKSKFLPVEGAVKITVKVNGHTAESIDVPARNGAVHVIGKVLIPPHRREDKHGADVSHLDSWENWEEWLPRWADEA